MTRKIRRAAFFFAAAWLAFPAPSARAAEQRRPSVVLVVLDSVRADHTSPYGHLGSSTPAMGKLAGRAVVFEKAYANGGWTGSSVATMLTGKRPFSHGLIGRSDSLPKDTVTIQSLLSGNGYETAVFLTGLPGMPDYGFSRGFGHVTAAEPDTPMSRQVAEALAWQRGLPAEKDFFMLIHGNDAHAPYICNNKDPIRAAGFPPVRGHLIKYYNGFPGWDMSKLDPEKWKRALPYRGNKAFLKTLSGAYDSCVSKLDSAIASLLSGLEASQERPLLIIVTADHGEYLGEHGLLAHGYGFFEQLVRVPLLISFPGQNVPVRTRIKAEHADLLPTICKAAGIPCPGGLDGKDLAENQGETGGSGMWAAAGGIIGNLRGIVELAAFSEKDKKIMLSDTKWKLFDLATDPGETRDLSRERPAEFLALASDYLVFSRFGGPVKEPPLPAESAQDCSLYAPAPPQEIPAGTEPCERSRIEAEELSGAGDPDGAAEKLATSGCPPAVTARYQETLKMQRRAFEAVRPPRRRGYVFSTAPGRWEMQKDGFSVIYSTASGLKCETGTGRPAQDPVCADLAEAMLNCAERYRFSGRRDAPRNEALEEALRKAGYLP